MMHERPIILGVVGDSATGKTTVTDGLVKLIGPERVTYICTDDYHKYDRVERAKRNITALHPECNYIDILELDLQRLAYGQPILKPVYDHGSGTFQRPVYIKPRPFVLVEGLLGFYTAAMRQVYDLMVYLDPDERLRRLWKIRRDTTKRHYTPEQVIKQIETREPDSCRFIRPQSRYADIVVQFYPPDDIPVQQAGSHLNVRLRLRPTIDAPDLSYLWNEDTTHDSAIRLDHGRDEHNRPVDILEIDGNVSYDQAAVLEQAIWQHVRELPPLRADQFGDYDDVSGTSHSDPLALTQLLLSCYVIRQENRSAAWQHTSPAVPPRWHSNARRRFFHVAQGVLSLARLPGYLRQATRDRHR